METVDVFHLTWHCDFGFQSGKIFAIPMFPWTFGNVWRHFLLSQKSWSIATWREKFLPRRACFVPSSWTVICGFSLPAKAPLTWAQASECHLIHHPGLSALLQEGDHIGFANGKIWMREEICHPVMLWTPEIRSRAWSSKRSQLCEGPGEDVAAT